MRIRQQTSWRQRFRRVAFVGDLAVAPFPSVDFENPVVDVAGRVFRGTINLAVVTIAVTGGSTQVRFWTLWILSVIR